MTLEDFYVEVLQKLDVLAAEESPTASDRKVVADKYVQIHAQYSRRDLFPWFDDEDVPDWAADAVAVITAKALVNKFSVPDGRKAEILQIEFPQAETVIIGDGQRRNVDSVNPEYY